MKCSRASFKIFELASIGFFWLRSRRGIAKFLTVRASTASKVEGSDVALKPRRINSIALITARIATTKHMRRTVFQCFIGYRLLSCSPTMIANQTLRLPETLKNVAIKAWKSRTKLCSRTPVRD